MNISELTKYLDIALRRKYWIIIPFFLTILAGLLHVLKTPKIYESETLILVQPQKVPQDFVRSIVSTDIEDRLRTITQQVTSRTNLEKIIHENDLFNEPPERSILIEEKVKLLRKRIKIDVARGGRGGSAFSISFRGKQPHKVMQVTNALASNFISENLKIRESQALGTSAFLTDELESIRRRLVAKENQLKEYRYLHMGALPEQLQSNLSTLERLQMQLEQLNSNLRDAENRKLIIQGQARQTDLLFTSASEQEADDLTTLRKELNLLESKYTPNHPDIRRLKFALQRLQTAANTSITTEQTPSGAPAAESKRDTRQPPASSPQIPAIDLQIHSIKAEIATAHAKMEHLQRKIEKTPRREQELLSMNRDYENIREIYNSILNRKLEAEIAVSMEKKQKGEQFRVIDPAKKAHLPVEPDVRKIILLTLVLGLGLGSGLAYVRELMDTSYKVPEEVELSLHLPVLASLPVLCAEDETRRLRTKKMLTVSSLALGFCASAVTIIVASKGLQSTIDYFNKLAASF